MLDEWVDDAAGGFDLGSCEDPSPPLYGFATEATACQLGVFHDGWHRAEVPTLGESAPTVITWPRRSRAVELA